MEYGWNYRMGRVKKNIRVALSGLFLIGISLCCVAGFAALAKFAIEPEPFAPHEGRISWPVSAPPIDDFRLTPEDSTFEERRTKVRDMAANPRDLLGGVISVREGRAPQIDDAAIEEAARRIDGREDCADFTMIRVVRVLYEQEAGQVLTAKQHERLKKAALGFKYWADEPGPDTMISWSENHQILFNSSEYLVGSLYPDEIFTNDGKDGRGHAAHAERLIRKWIDRRARWGFSEWDSNVYMAENLAALFTLADYAPDPEIAKLASMALDLTLFDIGSDLFRGMYACTHGRTYSEEITTARGDSVKGVVYQLWGFAKPDTSMDTVSLAMGSYQPPAALIKAFREIPEEFESRERHGINIGDAPAFGLKYDSPEDLIFFWGMGAFTSRQVLATSLKAFSRWNLWGHPFFGEVPEFAKKIRPEQIPAILGDSFILESDRVALNQVDKLTFRTPDYQLSSAQDYHPGGIGNQHHVWQATLSPDAVVYTTHPGSPAAGDDDRTPTYWGGTNRFPRVAQYKNTLVAIYDLENYTVIGQRNFYSYTHAFFPRWAFERVESVENWNFGKAGDSYIALYSSTPPVWTEHGRDAGVEIVANSLRNVWITILGRRADDGSFEDFKRAVLAAPPVVNGFSVEYTAPRIGLVKFGWTGPFTVAGLKIPLHGFKRFDNPFCRTDFDTRKFVISAGGSRFTLDFENISRTVEN
jgi:hypothetical protein